VDEARSGACRFRKRHLGYPPKNRRRAPLVQGPSLTQIDTLVPFKTSFIPRKVICFIPEPAQGFAAGTIAHVFSRSWSRGDLRASDHLFKHTLSLMNIDYNCHRFGLSNCRQNRGNEWKRQLESPTDELSIRTGPRSLTNQLRATTLSASMFWLRQSYGPPGPPKTLLTQAACLPTRNPSSGRKRKLGIHAQELFIRC